MKKYIKPIIKTKTMQATALMAASGEVDTNNPTSGLDNGPTYGGTNDGTHTICAKSSIWDN